MAAAAALPLPSAVETAGTVRRDPSQAQRRMTRMGDFLLFLVVVPLLLMARDILEQFCNIN